MNRPPSTRQRILEASRRLFNKKGYAATTLTEIARDVGISQGNLTYHFPTKKDLLATLKEEAQRRTQDRRSESASTSSVDDYLDKVVATTRIVWENRFLFRDKSQFEAALAVSENDPDLEADFDELYALLTRLEKDGMLRDDPGVDLATLARSLWIVSRYWMDFLLEFEGVEEVAWADQRRGLDQHFAVLFPCLRARARKQFQDALARRSTAEE